MRFGTFLFIEGIREKIRRFEKYEPASWDDLVEARVNCLSNTDDSGVEYEGEIDHININGDSIEVICKWVNRRVPYFDEDGDIDESCMYWEPHSVLSASFSSADVPRLMPDGSGFVVGSKLDYNNFTLNKFSKTTTFLSRVS